MTHLSQDLFNHILGLYGVLGANREQEIILSNEGFEELGLSEGRREFVFGGHSFKLLVPDKNQLKFGLYTLK